jgi:hypothetical protein
MFTARNHSFVRNLNFMGREGGRVSNEYCLSFPSSLLFSELQETKLPWNETYLIMVYDLLNVLLDSVSTYFVLFLKLFLSAYNSCTWGYIVIFTYVLTIR